MLTILTVSIGIGLLLFSVAWLKHNLSTTQEPENEKQQSNPLETVLDATLNNLHLDIGSEAAAEAAIDGVVEEGSQGIIEAIFESVGNLFDGL
jgi:hypothetical protein